MMSVSSIKPKLHCSLLAIIINALLFSLGYSALYHAGYINIFPDNFTLVNWDAKWYEAIATFGYYYVEGRTNPMAFFPLFPFLWFLTGTDAVSISILNFLIFSSGFYLIARHFDFNLIESLLFLSTPSLFFCFVPYSEALFFLGTTILLIGLDRENWKYVIIGLLVATLSRSIGMVFTAAIIFTYFLKVVKTQYDFKRTINQLLLLCFLTLTTTLFVFFIQFLFSGKWWVFFAVQSSWNRNIELPSLPFTTLTGIKTLWVDGLAFFVCLFSLIFCTSLVVKLQERKPIHLAQSTVFSVAYLAVVGIVSTFYSGVWGMQEGTSIMSINRFVFSTPFFICFANDLRMRDLEMKKNYSFIILIVVVMFSAWLLLGAFNTLPGHADYLMTLRYFANMSIYVLAYVLLKKVPFVTLLLYMVNILLQILLFSTYLHNNWVG